MGLHQYEIFNYTTIRATFPFFFVDLGRRYDCGRPQMDVRHSRVPWTCTTEQAMLKGYSNYPIVTASFKRGDLVGETWEQLIQQRFVYRIFV